MANLHIPFLLLQEGACRFSIDCRASRVTRDRIQQTRQSKASAEALKDSNLLVVSDKNTGCLALCQQESVITQSPSATKIPNKFIVSVKPRILCVPSIYPSDERLN